MIPIAGVIPHYLFCVELTHWGREKMVVTFLTTFSYASECLLPRVWLTYSSIGLDIGLAPVRQQDSIWTDDR